MTIDQKSSPDQKIAALIAPIAATLSNEVQDTLPRIEGLPSQVLALRRYLRVGDAGVADKWTWTQQHYNDFSLTYASVELRRSVEAVKAKFETDNPGYVLKTAKTFRPLDRQITNFCSSAKVRAAAVILGKAVAGEVDGYPDAIDEPSVRKFRHFLRSFHFSKEDEPSIAVPGISDHGRAQAIDFVVFKDGVEVAGISMAQVEKVWKKDGFEDKLNQAVKGSVNLFKREHLLVPYEPWHYDLRTDVEPARWSGELTFASLG